MNIHSMKTLRTFLLVVTGLLLLVALILRLRYGGGGKFADRSTADQAGNASLELVATLSEPPGNIAVSAKGRVFITVHPESKPEGAKVVEIVQGNPVAFPDAKAQQLFHAPQGIRIDRQNRLWTIDHADNGLGQPRLLAFSVDTGLLLHRYDFPRAIAPRLSYLQDLVVAPDGRFVFIADVNFFGKMPALVVYDTQTRTARRVLERDASLSPQDYIIQAYNGPMTRVAGLIAMKPGADSITIDQRGEWVYFGAMVHEALFRIRAADLTNDALDQAALSAKVERYADKILSDGISIDSAGNIYLTDVEHNGVAVIDTDRRLKTYVRDKRIRWADGLSFAADGWLYLADSAIPDIVLESRAHVASRAPYHLFRFKPIAAAIAGQ